MSYSKRLIGLISLLFLSSCLNYGPKQLISNREGYNVSLQHSDTQQQLLNIVRLRYNDSPYFLSVSNIISQFSYQSALNVGVTNSYLSPTAFDSSVSEGITLSESPTITFTPLQGEDFIKKLLTPIDMRLLLALLNEEGPDTINYLFRLLIQSMGPFENSTVAEKQDEFRHAAFREFQALCALLQALRLQSNLLINYGSVNGHFAIKLSVPHLEQLTEKQRSLLAKLGITKAHPAVWLGATDVPQTNPEENNPLKDTPPATRAPAKKTDESSTTKEEESDPNEAITRISTINGRTPIVRLKMRTLLGVFNYLSKSVQIPPNEIAQNRVVITRLPNGQYFDWRSFTFGVMDIRYSIKPPKNAYTCVRYNGYWFYVSESDHHSKSCLAILTVLMGIYEGDIKGGLQPIFAV